MTLYMRSKCKNGPAGPFCDMPADRPTRRSPALLIQVTASQINYCTNDQYDDAACICELDCISHLHLSFSSYVGTTCSVPFGNFNYGIVSQKINIISRMDISDFQEGISETA